MLYEVIKSFFFCSRLNCVQVGESETILRKEELFLAYSNLVPVCLEAHNHRVSSSRLRRNQPLSKE